MNAVYSNVTVVTYDYYSFPFCSHEGKAKVDESLGEWFLGGRIRGAPFSFTFLKQEEKIDLCEKTIGKKGEKERRSGQRGPRSSTASPSSRRWDAPWIRPSLSPLSRSRPSRCLVFLTLGSSCTPFHHVQASPN